MEFSVNDFISIDEVVADVVRACNDQEYSYRAKSFYQKSVFRALDALAMDAKCFQKTLDININSNNILPFPSGFNINSVWAYDSGFGCGVKVDWQRDFNVYGLPEGEFSSNNHIHPPHHRGFSHHHHHHGLFTYNVINGEIHISKETSQKSILRITQDTWAFNEFTDRLVVPRIALKAITLYSTVDVLENQFLERIMDNKGIGAAIQLHRTELHGQSGRFGEWGDAISRFRSMSMAQRDQMNNYLYGVIS